MYSMYNTFPWTYIELEVAILPNPYDLDIIILTF